VQDTQFFWKPLEGTWHLEQNRCDDYGEYFEDGDICIVLHKFPGKRSRKTFPLNVRSGRSLLESFCKIDSRKKLVRFLNVKGSIETEEPSPEELQDLQTSLRTPDRLKPDEPYLNRQKIESKDIERLLKFASTLKWIREFVEDLNCSEVDPRRLIKYLKLDPYPSGEFAGFVSQRLRVKPELKIKLSSFDGQPIPLRTFDVPLTWTCQTKEVLIQRRSRFVLDCARKIAQGIMNAMVADLAPTIGVNFKPEFAPRTPIQAMCLALVEEASNASSIKFCECARKGCPKLIRVGGASGRKTNVKYLTSKCRQSVYDKKKREQRAAKGKIK
jgi:hypothetical protein